MEDMRVSSPVWLTILLLLLAFLVLLGIVTKLLKVGFMNSRNGETRILIRKTFSQTRPKLESKVDTQLTLADPSSTGVSGDHSSSTDPECVCR